MSKETMSIEDYISDVLGLTLEDGVGYFTGDDYRTAIIGISTDGCLVYSYERMVEHYMNENNCDEESAREWIDYNAIRTIPYMGTYPPVVVYEVD